MKKWFFYSIFIFVFFVISIGVLIGEDKAWVDCSNEDDLYRYVTEGWKVEKVLKNGDQNIGMDGTKYIYKHEYPQIWLFKGDKIKALNFGSRCYFLEGPELNFTKGKIYKS